MEVFSAHTLIFPSMSEVVISGGTVVSVTVRWRCWSIHCVDWDIPGWWTLKVPLSIESAFSHVPSQSSVISNGGLVHVQLSDWPK